MAQKKSNAVIFSLGHCTWRRWYTSKSRPEPRAAADARLYLARPSPAAAQGLLAQGPLGQKWPKGRFEVFVPAVEVFVPAVEVMVAAVEVMVAAV